MRSPKGSQVPFMPQTHSPFQLFLPAVQGKLIRLRKEYCPHIKTGALLPSVSRQGESTAKIIMVSSALLVRFVPRAEGGFWCTFSDRLLFFKGKGWWDARLPPTPPPLQIRQTDAVEGSVNVILWRNLWR